MSAENLLFRIYLLSDSKSGLLLLFTFRDGVAHIRIGLNVV
jgi:hypothetical protein